MAPLRDIENRAGVVYDPSKKNRIFAEDLQGLDERITTIEEDGGGGGGGSGNLDGGTPFSIYGGTTPVDGGTP